MKVGPPAPFRIEQPSLLREVLEDLLDEERVAFGLPVDRLDEHCRRGLTSECLEHRRDARLRKWLQSDAVSEALPDQ